MSMTQPQQKDGKVLLWQDKPHPQRGRTRRGSQSPHEDVPAHADAQVYEALRGVEESDGPTVVVDCPLPGYEGLSVAYRTNNSVAVRWLRPKAPRPKDVPPAPMPVGDDAPDPEKEAYIAAVDEYIKMLGAEGEAFEAEVNQYVRDMAAWTCRFVRGFSGWPLKRAVGRNEDGTVRYEPEPKPDYLDPESFVRLFAEHDDLTPWLIDTGYQAALERKLGN